MLDGPRQFSDRVCLAEARRTYHRYHGAQHTHTHTFTESANNLMPKLSQGRKEFVHTVLWRVSILSHVDGRVCHQFFFQATRFPFHFQLLLTNLLARALCGTRLVMMC